MRRKAFAMLKPVNAVDASETESTSSSSSSSALTTCCKKARLIPHEHYFPTWNMHIKHERCSRQSPMEYSLTAGFGNLIYVSHRRAENVNSMKNPCEHIFVVQVNACVLHICVAHASPHVHIRVCHVYAYVCYKPTLVKHVCVIQVCTSVAREHKCLFQVSPCMSSR